MSAQQTAPTHTPQRRRTDTPPDRHAALQRWYDPTGPMPIPAATAPYLIAIEGDRLIARTPSASRPDHTHESTHNLTTGRAWCGQGCLQAANPAHRHLTALRALATDLAALADAYGWPLSRAVAVVNERALSLDGGAPEFVVDQMAWNAPERHGGALVPLYVAARWLVQSRGYVAAQGAAVAKQGAA